MSTIGFRTMSGLIPPSLLFSRIVLTVIFIKGIDMSETYTVCQIQPDSYIMQMKIEGEEICPKFSYEYNKGIGEGKSDYKLAPLFCEMCKHHLKNRLQG